MGTSVAASVPNNTDHGIVHTPSTTVTLAGQSLPRNSATSGVSTTRSSALQSGAINVGRLLEKDRTGLRCASCRLPVTESEADAGQVIYSLRRLWHRSHFCCVRCNVEIGMDGRDFRESPGAKDRPMCLDCYMETTHPRCFCCGKPLMETFVRVGKNRWHKSCMTCERCKCPFPNNEYMMLDGKLYDFDCFHIKKLEPFAAPATSTDSNDSSSTCPSSDASSVSTTVTKPDPAVTSKKPGVTLNVKQADNNHERLSAPLSNSSASTVSSMEKTQPLSGATPEKLPSAEKK
uniref:LIM zinc-binding domain-containing protein n=1 Tax=Steinernema glaseri TaxID=37863 RepID=A0A1I7ZUT2_9BILA